MMSYVHKNVKLEQTVWPGSTQFSISLSILYTKLSDKIEYANSATQIRFQEEYEQGLHCFPFN